MFKHKVAEHFTTEAASRIVFSSKWDGSLRFCVEDCKQNAVLLRDSYPILQMDKFINSLSSQRILGNGCQQRLSVDQAWR